VELSDENGRLLWVPPGFAHGFCVLGQEDSDVMYKVDAPYSPKTEGGIRFDDPDLKIEWPVKDGAIVSPKDRVLPGFAEYAQNPLF
jgi:dTDP-4-dehydrorhamnose 3,5-epimerase